MNLDIRTAVSKINQHGVLLVFPIQNRPEPASLWSQFFPKRQMRWEWNHDGDDRVPQLWHLMKRLSENKKVVYSKWYQGRATFFSRPLFQALLRITHSQGMSDLSPQARLILDVLEQDSPLSTKELKRMTDLQGRLNEGLYQRAMKELFQRFLIVGFGEVEDGAFPSLAVGATRLIYEDLWLAAQEMPADQAQARVERELPAGSKLRRFLDRIRDGD